MELGWELLPLFPSHPSFPELPEELEKCPPQVTAWTRSGGAEGDLSHWGCGEETPYHSLPVPTQRQQAAFEMQMRSASRPPSFSLKCFKSQKRGKNDVFKTAVSHPPSSPVRNC